MNLRELLASKRQAKELRASLREEHRDWVDSNHADIWLQANGDVERAAEITRLKAGELSLDPMTILAIINACIAIYRLLKQMGVLGSAASVTAVALGDEDD